MNHFYTYLSCLCLLLPAFSLRAAQYEEELVLDRRLKEAKKLFHEGDYSPIEKAHKDHDLPFLWQIFYATSRAREQRAEFWDAIETRVRQALLSHPDHAVFLGNKLEEFSSD